MSILQSPGKEVDIELLVFVQRYATDLLQWDILVFFAQNPRFSGSAAQIAGQIGRSAHSVQPEIGNLTLLGILERRENVEAESVYCLTTDSHLRQMMLKFGAHLTPESSLD